MNIIIIIKTKIFFIINIFIIFVKLKLNNMFLHTKNQIDPKDNFLLSYHKDKKWFVTEYSDLRGSNISIENARISIYSHKYKCPVVYQKSSSVRSNEGELLVDIFLPLALYDTSTHSKAYIDAIGTELHILND